MGNIRILVADNHRGFREGLCRILAREAGLEIVGQADDGEEVVNLTRFLKPDVAIIDIEMSKIDGFDATKRIKTVSPNTSVLLTGVFHYEKYILESLRAGAAGYLAKNITLRELVTCIEDAHAGRALIFPNNTDFVSNENIKKGYRNLPPQEIKVLKLVAKGLKNQEIAIDLRITEQKVQELLNNIFDESGVKSRTGAVLRGLKKGWLELGDLT